MHSSHYYHCFEVKDFGELSNYGHVKEGIS